MPINFVLVAELPQQKVEQKYCKKIFDNTLTTLSIFEWK